MPRNWRTWCAVLSVAFLAPVAGAQDEGSSSSYFDCPYVNYFDDGCPQLEKDRARVPQPPEAELERPELEGEQEADQDWTEDNPELLLPLFPKESLAPDTPDLYRMLLIRPDARDGEALRALVRAAHEPHTGSPGAGRGGRPGTPG